MQQAGRQRNRKASVSLRREGNSRNIFKCIHWMLIVALIAVPSWIPVAHAQTIVQAQPTGESSSPGIDIEPPSIELEETPAGIAGESQVFTAQVSDNQALKDVKLYYRFSGQGPFTSLVMQPLSGTGYYTAKIPTSRNETRAIEYYLQARDQSGNRVVTGYAFDPLIRTLNIPKPDEPKIVAAPADTPETTQQDNKNGGIKWWHIALGVLAAGAIAAGMADGDGQNGDNGPVTGTGVPITLTATPPN